MMRDALLATGLLFATFTQLRFSGLALGVGEMCLVGWIVLTFGHMIGRLSAPISLAVLQLSAFWLLIATALCIGTLTAVMVGERNQQALFIHDIAAYALVACMSVLAVSQANAATRLRHVAWFLVLLGSACLAVLLAQALDLMSTFGIELWFYDRLIGWSTNANQLALLCLILALLSCHLAETTQRRDARLAALCCMGLPIWAGYLTRSDAFLLTLAFSLPGLVCLKCWRALFAPVRLGLTLPAMLAVFALPAILASSSPLVYALMGNALVEGPGPYANQAIERDFDSRTELWEQAIARGLESGMLGLGPGPHLTRPVGLSEPRFDALPDFEAHNTLVDMFLQGGLLAVASLLWLGITTARSTLNANLCTLSILLIAVGGFALTHFAMRHPIFWFVIALALVASTAVPSRRA